MRSTPTMAKTFVMGSSSQTMASEPSCACLEPLTSTPRPLESRKVTFVRSTMTCRFPRLTLARRSALNSGAAWMSTAPSRARTTTFSRGDRISLRNCSSVCTADLPCRRRDAPSYIAYGLGRGRAGSRQGRWPCPSVYHEGLWPHWGRAEGFLRVRRARRRVRAKTTRTPAGRSALVEDEAGEELGVEVGRLLGHRLAQFGHRLHIDHRRGAEEGREVVVAAVEIGHGVVDALGK